MDKRPQAGAFGQVVEGLPQGVGQDAHEDMGLGTAGIVMPDGSQQEFAFEDAESFVDHRELDVGFPEFLGGPAGLVTAEQVGAVARQGLFEFSHAPGVSE